MLSEAADAAGGDPRGLNGTNFCKKTWIVIVDRDREWDTL